LLDRTGRSDLPKANGRARTKSATKIDKRGPLSSEARAAIAGGRAEVPASVGAVHIREQPLDEIVVDGLR
jgi:hypothetical protein